VFGFDWSKKVCNRDCGFEERQVAKVYNHDLAGVEPIWALDVNPWYNITRYHPTHKCRILETTSAGWSAAQNMDALLG
jgi:hypothetical protein